MIVSYKPWGNIDWITNKLNVGYWDFLGTVSTEERSLCAWMWLKDNRKLRNYEMWKINDISDHPSPYVGFTDQEYSKRESEYFRNGGQNPLEFALFTSDENASKSLVKFLEETDGDLIIDISTMPKRWFFPLIKECIENPKVKNLLVTYTTAKSYSKKQGEDPMPWRYFPSFSELPERAEIEKYFIISAGYQPLSLSERIISPADPKIYILFPFPASISGYTRVWDFIRTVESDCEPKRGDSINIKYVSGFDLPVIYDTLSKIIKFEDGKEPILIPYGPKPVSLAFAMLSSQRQFPAGYTQPRYYNPYYSSGFEETVNKVPKTISYLLKGSGRMLYLPPSITYT
jgi:hypothetical protein